MRVRVKRQNVTDRELAKALSGLIIGERLEHAVKETLEKSGHKSEPIPERYVRGIDARMQNDYRELMDDLQENIDRWTAYQGRGKKRIIQKAEGDPPVLSQNQIDELKTLIEAHFRHAIGIGWDVPKQVQKQFDAAGIQKPDVDLVRWIKMSYVAGRLSEILTNGSTYEEMRKLAQKLPLSRVDQLAIEAAKQNAAKYVVGYAERLASLTENVMLTHNKGLMHNVIQQYFEGDLKHTRYNEEGLSPEEIGALETDKTVNGWRELATEIRSRFKTTDAGRDWERVARTELRYSTNMGRLVNIQIEGGGNPNEIEVYYHVQPMACPYCKELFLHKDGTPKVFKLSDILHNVQDTGGLQIGLKASLIGEQGGWVANATCHPNGHCYPVRIIPGLEPAWYKKAQ